MYYEAGRAYTDEELEQKLARVLAYASREVLNDAEVQKFHLLYEEILRRALAVTAAYLTDPEQVSH